MRCPFCGSDNVVKAGKKRNKYVVKQQYLCNECKRRFIEHDGFENMTYPKEIIAKTLHLYAEGLSLSKIRNYIYQHEGYYLYDGVILYWVKKYADLLSEFESGLKPEVKGRVHTDEAHVKVNGKDYYVIDSIDSGTKYDLATTFTEHRSDKVCRKHFRKLKDKIGEQVKETWEREKNKPPRERKLITFVSDGFEGYKIGFAHYFHRYARLVFGVSIGSKKHGVKHNNNAIERHNEDYRQRYKVTRGFKDPESGEAFTELRRIVYDFVRPHQTLGKTPAEAAGLNVVVRERNKLLALIIFLRILFSNFLFEFLDGTRAQGLCYHTF